MLFCQDKEIGVEAMERKRIEYIDWLRIISAIAVIGIHITMTQPNNYSVRCCYEMRRGLCIDSGR